MEHLFAWFVDRISAAGAYSLAVNLPYAVAFACVGAEVAWLARRPGSARRAILRSAATATAMAAGALAVGVAYTAVLRFLWTLVATRQWDAAADFWQAHPVIGAVAAFVAWDLSGWVYHVIGHRTRVGWAGHQPHHTGEEYDATLGLRQSWAPFHGLLHHPLLALAGFDLRVVTVCAAVSNCWQVLEHTSLPIRFPRWFEAHDDAGRPPPPPRPRRRGGQPRPVLHVVGPPGRHLGVSRRPGTGNLRPAGAGQPGSHRATGVGRPCRPAPTRLAVGLNPSGTGARRRR